MIDNMKNESPERYQVVNINVKISTGGRGLSNKDIEKMCRKLEKTAKGRSQERDVSAVC